MFFHVHTFPISQVQAEFSTSWFHHTMWHPNPTRWCHAHPTWTYWALLFLGNLLLKRYLAARSQVVRTNPGKLTDGNVPEKKNQWWGSMYIWVMVSKIFYVHPYLEKMNPFWLIFFQMGWFNHQLVLLSYWNSPLFRGHVSFRGVFQWLITMVIVYKSP